MEAKDFKPMQSIELHPATDRWMRGDRFGIIESVGRKLLRVRMHVSGQVIRVSPDNIGAVFNAYNEKTYL